MSSSRSRSKGKEIPRSVRWAAPLLASCVGLLLATLLMLPMLKMQPQDIPVGILSLDQGVEHGGNTISLGSQLVDSLSGEANSEDAASQGGQGAEALSALDDRAVAGLLGTEGDAGNAENSDDATGYVSSDAIEWIVADDAEQLQQFIDSGECYATVVIPEGFSEAVLSNAGRAALGREMLTLLPDLAAGADALESGLGQLAGSLSASASGASSPSSNATELPGGASALAASAGTLTEGASRMVDGLDAASAALAGLPSDADQLPTLQLVINQGKNPMVSSSLASAFSSLGASSGVSFDIEYTNPLPSEMSMGFTHMILMMLTYLSSYATATVIASVLKLRRSGFRSMLASLGLQVAFAALCSLVIGLGASGVLVLATGADIAFADLVLFTAIASFSFQMLVLGSMDLFGSLGMIVPIGLLVVGMGTAYLPTEFLPAFWQNWIYPWDPLRFMADGFREILYMGQSFANSSVPALLAVIGVGVVLMAICMAKASKTWKQPLSGKASA